MGFFKRMKSSYSAPRIGDVFSDSVMNFVVLLVAKQKIGASEVLVCDSNGYSFIPSNIFDSRYARVLNREDDEIVYIDVYGERKDARMCKDMIDRIVSDENLRIRLGEELEKLSSNKLSLRLQKRPSNK